MKDYIRPKDSRFQIDGVSMPRPFQFRTREKWENNGDKTTRNINNGSLILHPIGKVYETTWKYSLLIDDDYFMLKDAIFTTSKSKYKKGFKLKTIQRKGKDKLVSLEYQSYEQDDFEEPEIAFVKNGHTYYQDVEFAFTSMKLTSEK